MCRASLRHVNCWCSGIDRAAMFSCIRKSTQFNLKHENLCKHENLKNAVTQHDVSIFVQTKDRIIGAPKAISIADCLADIDIGEGSFAMAGAPAQAPHALAHSNFKRGLICTAG